MNIVPLTNQQAFDKALFGIRAQGYKASVGVRKDLPKLKGPCLYRGLDGLKCGVGHMIPDEIFNPIFDKGPEGGDGSGIITLLDAPYRDYYDSCDNDQDFLPLAHLFAECDRELLQSIQAAHDNWLAYGEDRLHTREQCIDKWESRMEELAVRHGLVYTPVEVTA